MIRFQPIVWPIGCVRRVLEPGIRPMRIARGLNPDIKIWPFFSRPARLIAFFARTGILKMELFHRQAEQLRTWFGMLIRGPLAFVILEETLRHNFLFP